MNLLFSCIGKRGYVADFFRPHLKAGDRIIGSGNTKWTPGFRSCDAAFILPDNDKPEYIPAVLDLCEREKVNAILSFCDPDVHSLAHAAEQFEARGIRMVIPSARAADLAFDKGLMFKFLTDNGIPTPRTALDLEGSAGFSFPMFVKPRRGSGSKMTFRARNADELKVFFNYEPDMLIQEAAVGEEVNLEICSDFDGEPVGVSLWRKYRSTLGETEQAETFRDEQVLEFGFRFSRLLRATGPMDVDVIRTPDQLVLLEANPRFGGGYPVSHLAGADFPRLIVELIKHGRVEPHYGYATGVVMMKQLQIIGGAKELFFAKELHLA